MKTLHLIAAGALLAASPAFAATVHHDATGRLPAESAQGTVHYVSGGIGHDEAMAFRHAERKYPLSLEFAVKAKPRDEFTADVKVLIRDAKGKTVLDTTSTGPFLLARLPGGMYDIKVTQDGKTFERHISLVDRKPMHVGFVWPSARKATS
jgi:hypothetical protein